MANYHPPNAKYYSDDGLVSYDDRGRRLDSIGNVARQSYGGGGSGAPSAPEVPSYGGLPSQYLEGLKAFLGADPTEYYTTRGTEKAAQNDYYNMLNAWQNKTGVPLTADDWGKVWGGLTSYKTGFAAPNEQRAWTISDAFNYLGRMLTAAPQQTGVAYLKTGEI